MKSLDDIHAMLPDMDGFAYFQTSGFSPKLLPVVDEVIHWFRFQSRGPALPTVSEKSQEVFEEARKKVASSGNAEPGEIVLGENTTVGINIVANGIDWKPGDNVILSSHEHPGNRLTWYNIADRYGVNLKYLRISNDPSEMLDRRDYQAYQYQSRFQANRCAGPGEGNVPYRPCEGCPRAVGRRPVVRSHSDRCP